MIDFHTHVLPAIDDGASSVEQSMAMLRLLQADGVNTVVCSPHFYWGKQTIDEFLKKRDEAIKKLSDSPVKLVPAAEVEFGEITLDYRQFSRLRIGDTGYILIELPYAETWTNKLFYNLRLLMQETGLRPVIAHIDRYVAAVHTPSHIEELLSMGCLLQVNTDAVSRCRPHSVVDILLRYGQVQALGSDCHNDTTRPPRYAMATERIKSRYTNECLDYLQDCMQTMLSDEEVTLDYVHHMHKFFGFYR